VKWQVALLDASRSLRRAPGRSCLTALGVIIGVAAVVCTMSIGAGASARIAAILETPESRTIYFGAMPSAASVRRGDVIVSPADRLQLSDYLMLRQALSSPIKVSMHVSAPTVWAQARWNGTETHVEGIDEIGFVNRANRLIGGSTFSRNDVERGATVAIVNRPLLDAIYGNAPAVERVILLNRIPFRIIGVFSDARSPGAAVGSRPNEKLVYIPYTTLQRRIHRDGEIGIVVHASSLDHVTQDQERARALLLQHWGHRKSELYSTTALSAVRTHAEGSETMARLLASIGAVSLVVGGIGIMNIMLVTVTERVREVGIRVALGTRSRDILRQFLTEATLLSLAGGLVGIGVGVVAAAAITALNDWPTEITFGSILVAFVCSFGTGLVFGYQPALRAAKLPAIDALRAA
jgi:ABC-type antimicrobial peptide transport system permease subunit